MPGERPGLSRDRPHGHARDSMGTRGTASTGDKDTQGKRTKEAFGASHTPGSGLLITQMDLLCWPAQLWTEPPPNTARQGSHIMGCHTHTPHPSFSPGLHHVSCGTGKLHNLQNRMYLWFKCFGNQAHLTSVLSVWP